MKKDIRNKHLYPFFQFGMLKAVFLNFNGETVSF